jgi:pimeloyl-ACP methyl ester carboxylesterase
MYKFVLFTLITILSASFSQAEEIYLIRGYGAKEGGKKGLAASGINELAKALKKQGRKVITLNSGAASGQWRKFAKDIIKRNDNGNVSYPIILVGHSYGGINIVQMANELGKHKIPVKLMIGLDPGFKSAPKLKSHLVKRAESLFVKKQRVYKSPDSSINSRIKNIDVNKEFGLNEDHGSVDDSKTVRKYILKKISRSM